MMRTEAPKEREGRGLENLARTTPELPMLIISTSSFQGPVLFVRRCMYRGGG